jgi:cephalosporin-C deacetylase
MLYDGMLTLCLNLHGNTPDTPYKHPRVLGGEYVTQGIESPQTYIFRDIVGHCLCALKTLASLPDVDPDRIMIGGMSQGGGLSLVCAALSRIPVLCLADMPWMCDLDTALSLIDRNRYKPGMPVPDGRAYIREYAESHPEISEQVYTTFRYFDPLSHAGNIRVPTQLTSGGRDPSCRPQTIFSVYNEISVDKDIVYLPDTGHDVVPQMRLDHARWIWQHKQ